MLDKVAQWGGLYVDCTSGWQMCKGILLSKLLMMHGIWQRQVVYDSWTAGQGNAS
jgi:hypothetical protein